MERIGSATVDVCSSLESIRDGMGVISSEFVSAEDVVNGITIGGDPSTVLIESPVITKEGLEEIRARAGRNAVD